MYLEGQGVCGECFMRVVHAEEDRELQEFRESRRRPIGGGNRRPIGGGNSNSASASAGNNGKLPQLSEFIIYFFISFYLCYITCICSS